MRVWMLPAILCAAILSVVFTLPIFWQWDYRARLLRAVPLGSTHEQYNAALSGDKLGPGDLRTDITFSRPLNFHGFVYTIFSEPYWDIRGRLAGYNISARLSLRGHEFWLVQPDPELDSGDFLVK